MYILNNDLYSCAGVVLLHLLWTHCTRPCQPSPWAPSHPKAFSRVWGWLQTPTRSLSPLSIFLKTRYWLHSSTTLYQSSPSYPVYLVNHSAQHYPLLHYQKWIAVNFNPIFFFHFSIKHEFLLYLLNESIQLYIQSTPLVVNSDNDKVCIYIHSYVNYSGISWFKLNLFFFGC